MDESTLLFTMRRIIRGFKIKHDLLERLFVRRKECVHEELSNLRSMPPPILAAGRQSRYEGSPPFNPLEKE